MKSRMWSNIRKSLRTLRALVGTPGFRLREHRPFCSTGRIGILGIFSKHCGLQRVADLHCINLRNRGMKVERYDITSLTHHTADLERSDAKRFEELITEEPESIIIHAPAPIVNMILRRLGQKSYDRTSVAAFWHWETPRAPDTWRSTAKLLDEIWVPTPFVFEAVRAIVSGEERKLRLVRNPVEADPFPFIGLAERREAKLRLGIPAGAFVVGYTFSTGSGFERKNPLAALEAFSGAFRRTNSNVRFLLRCNDLDNYPAGARAIQERSEKDSRIILCKKERALPLQDFFAATDTLLSLHRSEGYGLTIAEAVQSGSKAIVTGWGLAPELQAMLGVSTVRYGLTPIQDPQGTYDSGDGLVWAEPDKNHAATLLKHNFSDYLAQATYQQERFQP